MVTSVGADARPGERSAAVDRLSVRALQRVPYVGPFLLWLRRNPFIAPALLYVIVVTQAPFVLTVWYSLHRWNLQRPENSAFNWFGNYLDIFRDGRFLNAVGVSVALTVGAVVLSLFVGLLYAQLVHDRFPGRGLVRTLLITPFLVMPVIGALSWKYTVLSPTFGILDWILQSLGGRPIDWLGIQPVPSIVAVLVWRWGPFMMIILLAGLQALDDDLREAARVDGAGALSEFRYIVVPHLKGYMQLCVLLGSIFIVNEFDVIFMATQGGPGTASTNVPFLIYQNVFYGFDVGRSAAMAVVIVVITIITVTQLLKVLGRLMTEGD